MLFNVLPLLFALLARLAAGQVLCQHWRRHHHRFSFLVEASNVLLGSRDHSFLAWRGCRPHTPNKGRGIEANRHGSSSDERSWWTYSSGSTSFHRPSAARANSSNAAARVEG